MKKKNVAYLEIDDKINEKPETINKDISDSNITKKIREKKVDSFANKYSKPKILSTSERKPYSPRNNSLYYINEVVRAINEKNSLALNHVNTSIKMMKACEVYQIPSLNEI